MIRNPLRSHAVQITKSVTQIQPVPAGCFCWVKVEKKNEWWMIWILDCEDELGRLEFDAGYLIFDVLNFTFFLIVLFNMNLILLN